MNVNTEHSIQTFSGIFFDPFNPDPAAIRIEDIARSLCQQPRFLGHLKERWTVGMHSVMVSRHSPEDVKLWALLHDASEAYMCDLPRPLKRHPMMHFYRETEANVMQAVAKRFGLAWPMPEVIHEVDNLVLVAEARSLKEGVAQWESWRELQDLDTSVIEDDMEEFVTESDDRIESVFLKTFDELTDHKRR